MDSKNVFQFRKRGNETDEAFERRKEIAEKIYAAILPLLGPEQTKEILQVFNHRVTSAKPDLRPVLEQVCELCEGPMKIEEFDEEDSHQSVVTCIDCGYMDVLKK